MEIISNCYLYIVLKVIFFFSQRILEKAMAPHSSTLAWKIPWMEEPGRLQSMVSRRVGHDWATSLSPFTFMHWSRKWQPTPVFLPGESQGRGSLVGCCLWGRTSRTRLKRLSSSSSSMILRNLRNECPLSTSSPFYLVFLLSSMFVFKIFRLRFQYPLHHSVCSQVT